MCNFLYKYLLVIDFRDTTLRKFLSLYFRHKKRGPKPSFVFASLRLRALATVNSAPVRPTETITLAAFIPQITSCEVWLHAGFH